MFQVTEKPIDLERWIQKARNPRAGAFVEFQGWVRDHNEGKKVQSLEYEIFESLARKEAVKIITKAKAKFQVLDIQVVHRVGHMDIGDLAVWVGVSSEHRSAGFRACRYVMDEVKVRLPIWKKEYYLEEDAKWVNCQGCYQKKIVKQDYYEKQIKLKNLGEPGQKRLQNSQLLVVGAGGLGCPALSYLVAAGVGQITICDPDLLEVSNLHRQTLYSHENIGEYKVNLAKAKLESLNPFVHIQGLSKRVDLGNVQALVASHDLVLDCTDNFESKFLIHDACFFFKKNPDSGEYLSK